MMIKKSMVKKDKNILYLTPARNHKGLHKWILVLLMAAILTAGCIGDAENGDGGGDGVKSSLDSVVEGDADASDVTSTFFSVVGGGGDGGAPHTPIILSMSMPETLALNEVNEITITVSSILDAPNTTVDLILPEGATLVSDVSAWEVDLVANETVTFTAKIIMTTTGNWEITAIAKHIIDEENSWGDMDVKYINYQSSKNDDLQVERI